MMKPGIDLIKWTTLSFQNVIDVCFLCLQNVLVPMTLFVIYILQLDIVKIFGLQDVDMWMPV